MEHLKNVTAWTKSAGYRHYADDVVDRFVERAALNGVDVFRIFDAMNDMRILETAIRAAKRVDKHAQGTISYTVSPVHNLQLWLDLARQIEDQGADSLCIKDMAGLLKPYVAFELVSELKAALSIPIHMQCHATTGMSTATYVKSIEAGIDNVDTSISSMSMTYVTRQLNPWWQFCKTNPGYRFGWICSKKYLAIFARCERSTQRLRVLAWCGLTILVAQVPGSMLTNLESQLREQNAQDRLDEVLAEIPKVREELGYIPLVTPTSQIVGTQAVINVLTGERYKSVTKETAGVLAGEYGATPAPLDAALQQRVLEGAEPITCRPADLLAAEMESLTVELEATAAAENIALADAPVDDVLTYALFPQVGLKFLQNRGDASAFEPAPSAEVQTSGPASVAAQQSTEVANYSVAVDVKVYQVQVAAGQQIQPVQAQAAPVSAGATTPLQAGLTGTVNGTGAREQVVAGQTVMILGPEDGNRSLGDELGLSAEVLVRQGDAVVVGQNLLTIAEV